MKHAEKLCAHGRELETRLQEPQRALAEEEAFFARMRAAQPPQPAQDLQILREKWAALGPVAQWHANGREANLAASDAARVLAEKCVRLAPPLTDIYYFARSPSPDLASIEQAARIFDAIDARETGRAAKGARGAKPRLKSAEKQLAQLERQGAVASIESLHQARADRDAEWSGLRAFLRGDSPAPGDAFWTEKAEKFETLATEADRRADALLADSARVAAADAAREKIAAARARSRGGRKASGGSDAGPRAATRPLGRRSGRPAASRRWRRVKWPRGAGARTPCSKPAKLWPRCRPRRAAGTCGSRRRARIWRPCPGNAVWRRSKISTGAALARRIEARLDELAKAQDAAREAQAKIADAPNRIAQWKATDR